MLWLASVHLGAPLGGETPPRRLSGGRGDIKAGSIRGTKKSPPQITLPPFPSLPAGKSPPLSSDSPLSTCKLTCPLPSTSDSEQARSPLPVFNSPKSHLSISLTTPHVLPHNDDQRQPIVALLRHRSIPNDPVVSPIPGLLQGRPLPQATQDRLPVVRGTQGGKGRAQPHRSTSQSRQAQGRIPRPQG